MPTELIKKIKKTANKNSPVGPGGPPKYLYTYIIRQIYNYGRTTPGHLLSDPVLHPEWFPIVFYCIFIFLI